MLASIQESATTGPTEAALAPHPDRKCIIDTHELRKVYQMGEMEVHALRGVSIQIYEGEMVAIVGPSGSGKSTLMAILGILDVPSAGKYMLDGIEIRQMHEDDLALIRNDRIGFVFQKFNLLSRSTVLDNVILPMIYRGLSKNDRIDRAKQVLEMVGLGDRIHHKPTELSGGQQQRVAIARALANDPALVLADEPTGNLDTKTGEQIMELFHKLNKEQGITIVIVTHDPEVAAQADRIISLRDGLIEADQTTIQHKLSADDEGDIDEIASEDIPENAVLTVEKGPTDADKTK
ncbi:MAG: ABC transporter ATP-binding protein [Anaerolineae bacterium]|nr:ABC transporter ATP-binding protein [Anaerolineae bacterium]